MQKDVEKLIQKRREIESAIIAGLKESERYDKPYDKQRQIILYLDMGGYTIVKKNKRSQ